MRDVSLSNFGLLVAYLLPGFLAMWGIALFSSTVRSWLLGATTPTVGGFLYVTLASVGSGLVASTIRWAVIDPVHHATGVRQPDWDFEKLQPKLQAFELLVESHYRYYQFYGNTIIAMLFVYAAWKSSEPHITLGVVDLGALAGIALFFAASRDTLRKYYSRSTALLGGS